MIWNRGTRLVGFAACAACAVTTAGLAQANSGRGSFTQRANSICTTLTSRESATYEQVTANDQFGSQQWAVQRTGGYALAQSIALGHLNKVTPPAPLRRRYTLFLHARKQMLSDLRAENAAARRGKISAFKTADAQYGKDSQAAYKLAVQLKLASCAFQSLSEADMAAIKKVILRVMLVNDPSECTQALTPAGVRRQFGTQANCVNAQEHPPSPNPKSVRFLYVKGAGTFGDVRFVLHFASGPDQTGESLMYKQHGRWRSMGAP